MTVSDEARALARKAKAELIRRGRYVGDYADFNAIRNDGASKRDCRVCILGAISAADSDPSAPAPNLMLLAPSPPAEEVVVALAERIGRRMYDSEADNPYDWETDIDTVARWHDRDTTTDDDVYRLLDDIAGDALSEPSELAVQGAT